MTLVHEVHKVHNCQLNVPAINRFNFVYLVNLVNLVLYYDVQNISGMTILRVRRLISVYNIIRMTMSNRKMTRSFVRRPGVQSPRAFLNPVIRP